MNVSQTGAELVASFEGGRSPDGLFHPYWDKYGSVWTIGFGHTRAVGPHTRPLTLAGAQQLLRQDLDRVYAPIVQAVGVPLNQHQFDALVSFVYNCGGLWLQKGHLIGDALRRLDWPAVVAGLLLFNHDIHGQVLPGLTARRKAEAALFLSPVPHLPLPWLTPDERRWCLELDRLAHAHLNVRRRRVLRRTITAQAARIQYAAMHQGGWDKANRRERYHSLLARCT